MIFTGDSSIRCPFLSLSLSLSIRAYPVDESFTAGFATSFFLPPLMEKCDVTIYGIFLNFLFSSGDKDDKGGFWIDELVEERVGKRFLALTMFR